MPFKARQIYYRRNNKPKMSVKRDWSLAATISKLEDKNQALQHDYQFIAQEKANLLGQLQSFKFRDDTAS